MQRKKLIFVMSLITLVILILVILNGYIPKNLVSEENNNIIISSILYQGSEIPINDDEVLDVLNKYKSRKTTYKMGNYQNDKVKIEINIYDNHKPKHILLGEFNIWYEAVGKSVFKIINGPDLLEELTILFKQNY